jgi:hypothetical protein
MEGQALEMPKTAEEDKSAALWYTLAGRVAFYFYGGILVVGIILPALVLAGRGNACRQSPWPSLASPR